ncbi:hypothetical protein AAF712_008028 [Marasmius tenuissimus]|uniref:Uncharacterized protein n=1 Tax=Marasmius tenuissimus TaxID=585030 RepID=A0ABR2ZW73_9AGAR
MPPPTIRDADDSIVLSDLVRSGEASRLRRRGAIRSSHQRVASTGSSTSVGGGGSVVYRLFCRGGEDAGTGEGLQGWSDEPFRPELFPNSTSTSKGKEKQLGGCGALIHLSAFTTPTDSTSYTSIDKPTSLVVPLDAVYFRDRQQQPVSRPTAAPEDPRSPYPPSPMYSTEVEHDYGYGYFDPSHKRTEDPFTDMNEDPCVLSKNACGCVTEGVGCQSCGTPIGTRFRPCRAARHSHPHHSRATTTTITGLDFTLARLHNDDEEDSGDEEYVEYTFFGDVVDAIAYPYPNPIPNPPEPDTERWGRRTSVWMPPAPVQRPHLHSYLSTSSSATSAYTIPLLESREVRDRDILADFLRRTGPSTPVFVPPPPSSPPRSRPMPRRRMRVGEDEVEDALRRAEDVLRMIGEVEQDEEVVVPSPPTPTIPIPIPISASPEYSSPTLPTPTVSDLVLPPSPSSSSSASLTPTQSQPRPDHADLELELPFPFPLPLEPSESDPDPEVTRALGLPWVGFGGTPTEEIDEPDFELGVLFDGEEASEPQDNDEAPTQPAPLDEEEEEDPWRTMPALRVVSDTEDEDDDSDSDARRGGWMFDSSEDEDEDENTPPVSWYTPPPPPPPLPAPTSDRDQLLREMDRTRILTAALRRYTLPTPPHSTLPIGETIPYAPPPRTQPRAPPFSINSTRDTPRPPLFSVNSGSTASWAHRNWDVDAYAPPPAPPPVDRVRGYLGRPPPRMERSFGGMGRVGVGADGDEDEDEGDNEKEEEEDGAVVIKTGTGNGVLFAM